MAEELRRQVASVCDNLLSAVNRLESQHASGTPPASSSSASSTSLTPAAPPSTTEFRRLFNFGDRDSSSSSQAGKRKRSAWKSSKATKMKKLKMWTHTFVCLSDPGQSEPPDHRLRALLQLAGLGENRFPVFLYGEADELQEELFSHYPKLAEGGGYEFLRQGDCGRELEVIPVPPEGYSVQYLKGITHAARLYIRPLQRTLDTSSRQVRYRYSYV